MLHWDMAPARGVRVCVSALQSGYVFDHARRRRGGSSVGNVSGIESGYAFDHAEAPGRSIAYPLFKVDTISTKTGPEIVDSVSTSGSGYGIGRNSPRNGRFRIQFQKRIRNGTNGGRIPDIGRPNAGKATQRKARRDIGKPPPHSRQSAPACTATLPQRRPDARTRGGVGIGMAESPIAIARLKEWRRRG